ncbi:MAG TPA: hypothetical protein VG015_08615, partial [Candidatus Dormibacteraeota bacterium]|nr:hypothetical protein [Candidatus Dormibacteraeota bacterium]
MLLPIPTPDRALSNYGQLVSDSDLEELRRLAEPLQGARVLHLTATAAGTHLAGTIRALVPLMRDLGLDAQWAMPEPGPDYDQWGWAVYEALAGGEVGWTSELLGRWEGYADRNAALLDSDPDFVVVHDPQPLPILDRLRLQRDTTAAWLWHCHLDLRDAQPEAWGVVEKYIGHYAGLVLEQTAFAGNHMDERASAVIPPAIDPLSPRNVEIPHEDQELVLHLLGINPQRQLMTQFCRMDMWTDSTSAFDVFRQVKPVLPDLQLAIVAQMGTDTGAYLQFEQLARRAANEPDVHLFSSVDGVGDVEINVLQRASTVNFQRSVRKGFAPILMEASWKGRPVVAGVSG